MFNYYSTSAQVHHHQATLVNQAEQKVLTYQAKEAGQGQPFTRPKPVTPPLIRLFKAGVAWFA